MSRRTSRRVAALEKPEPPPPVRPKRGVPETKDEMNDDQVAELWAQFAGDHYEIVEQLPLELHRNSRLLRELDSESQSQQTRLQARVREYVAYRIAVARPCELEEAKETEAQEEPPDIKPRVSEVPESPQEHSQEASHNAPLHVPPTDTRAASAAAAHIPNAEAPVAPSSAVASQSPGADAPADAPAAQPEEADEHAAEAAVEAALAPEDPHTPRASMGRRPAPFPKPVNLGEISSLISELVRNREEKVAIAVGAYNTIDRHIRALDSALSAQETSVLGFAPSAEPQPEPEPSPPKRGRGRQQRTSASASAPPTGLPPGIEVDPNEPRYCYCNQVSYGEMVGCDNDDCPMEWFHLACLGMTHPPAGEWMCDVCKAQKEGSGRGGPVAASGSHKKRRKR